jgi:hypothetical protein
MNAPVPHTMHERRRTPRGMDLSSAEGSTAALRCSIAWQSALAGFNVFAITATMYDWDLRRLIVTVRGQVRDATSRCATLADRRRAQCACGASRRTNTHEACLFHEQQPSFESLALASCWQFQRR